MDINIETIMLTAPQKRYKGKRLHRKRILTDGFTVKKIERPNNRLRMTINVKTPQITALLSADFCKNTGVIFLKVVSVETSSYLKKMKFTIAGYTVTAQLTTPTS